MSAAALLAIDVQQSFLHAPYWRDDDLPASRGNLLKLLDAAAARAGTARMASDLGFAVDYVTEATPTFPVVEPCLRCTGTRASQRGRVVTAAIGSAGEKSPAPRFVPGFRNALGSHPSNCPRPAGTC